MTVHELRISLDEVELEIWRRVQVPSAISLAQLHRVIQTIMPWQGIRFDATGQNIAATPVIQQIKDGKYHTIYPFDVAAEEAVWNIGK